MSSRSGASAKTLDETALEMARRFRLVDDDGVAWCINGCEATATLPTLECRACVEKRKRGWR